jgi:ribonuclease HI
MEELETINPFTIAPWTQRVQTILADEDDSETTQADLGWAVRVAVSSSTRNGVVGVGGVIEIPASARGGPRLERFSFTLGMRTEQNPFYGQLAATAYALRHLPNLEYRSVAVLTSNRAAVFTIRNPRQQSGQEYIGCIYDSINALEDKGNMVAVMWVPTSAEHRLLETAKREAQSASRDGAVPLRKFPKNRSTTLNMARSSQRTSKQLLDNVGKFSKRVDAAHPGKHTRLLYDGLSRREASVLAQLRTGMT